MHTWSARGPNIRHEHMGVFNQCFLSVCFPQLNQYYCVSDLQNFGFMAFESPDTVQKVLSERVSNVIIRCLLCLCRLKSPLIHPLSNLFTVDSVFAFQCINICRTSYF